MNPVLVFFLILLGIIAAVLAIVIPLCVVNEKYKNFVLVHSTALKDLAKINQHYNFNNIKSFNMEHS